MAPLTRSERKPVEYSIFLLSPPSTSPPHPQPHLPRTIAPSPLSPLRQPANYHLLSINQIRGVLIPSYSVSLACVPCTRWRGRGCGRSGAPHRRGGLCVGEQNQKAAYAAGICSVATSSSFFLFFKPLIAYSGHVGSLSCEEAKFYYSKTF